MNTDRELLELAAAPQPPTLDQPQVEQEPWTTVDCIGIALELESRVKAVESQTTERAMRRAAHALRLLYTHPQLPRQPLSNERIQELADDGLFYRNIFEIVRQIEEEHDIFMLKSTDIGYKQ